MLRFTKGSMILVLKAGKQIRGERAYELLGMVPLPDGSDATAHAVAKRMREAGPQGKRLRFYRLPGSYINADAPSITVLPPKPTRR